MSNQPPLPLVGPSRRRGLREMLRMAPLAASPHTALVITRRGGLVGVVPAGGRRTLSDYFDLPCEIREVDTRERPLVITRQCSSAEPGFAFDVSLQIAYQVVRPEHVALAHADVLAELEEAIDQRARVVAATLGVEQVSALKAYLVEALVTGNELPRRFEDLGLALRRVDVAVELGDPERTRAEAVRDQTRDRPLLARFRVESRATDATFDAQVGGFYRLSSRDLEAVYASAEETIYDIVARALGRVGTGYSPEQYHEAARTMTEQLWNDGVLKAELAAAGIELLRPAVHIYPDRALLEQLGRPLMLEDGRRRDTRIRRLSVSPRLALAAPRDDAEPAPYLPASTPETDPVAYTAEAEIVDAEAVATTLPAAPEGDWLQQWNTFAAKTGEASTYTVAETDPSELASAGTPPPNDVQLPDEPSGWSLSDESTPWADLHPANAELVALPTETADPADVAAVASQNTEAIAAATTESTEEPDVVTPVNELLAPFEEPIAPVAEAVEQLDDAADNAPVAEEILPNDTPVQRMVEQIVFLLQSSGPALYKLWSLEIVAAPGSLPEVLRSHTADEVLLAAATLPSVQRAVVAALNTDTPPVARRERTPVVAAAPVADDDAPDWFRLRETAGTTETP